LLYLAEKTGRFLPQDTRGRYEVLQWLFWQMGGLGPMAGQAHHFRVYAPEKIEYAIARYTDEVNRLYGVMDRRLSDREFLAGEYSIADMAAWPWIVPWKTQGQTMADFPNLKRWFEAIAEREAVKRARAVGRELVTTAPNTMDETTRKVLFGQTAATLKSR
jgi:GST-like protein